MQNRKFHHGSEEYRVTVLSENHEFVWRQSEFAFFGAATSVAALFYFEEEVSMTNQENPLNHCSENQNTTDRQSVSTTPPTTYDHIHRYLTEDRKNKIFKFELWAYLCTFIVLLIYSFVPLLTIGHSSLGNTWQVIGRILNESDLSDVMEYKVIAFPAICVSLLLFRYAFRIFLALVLRKNRFYYIRGKEPIALTIIIAVLKVVFLTALIIPILFFYNWYGFSGATFALVTMIAIHMESVISFHYQAVLRDLARDKKLLRLKEDEKREWRMARPLFTPWILVICFLTFFSSQGIMINYMPHNDLSDYIVYQEDIAGNYAFFNNYYIYAFEDETQTQLEDMKGDKITRSYSNNYLFYDLFIKETEKKILDMYPKDMSYEAMEKYAEDIMLLEQDIELAKEMQRALTYKYQETQYATNNASYGFYTLIFCDTTCGSMNDQPKWGMEKKWYHYFYEESITLSSTQFSTNTDFFKVNITAYITYNDGSYRYSFIRIENAEELNQAEPGIHVLKWSDEWGSYETDIVIRKS